MLLLQPGGIKFTARGGGDKGRGSSGRRMVEFLKRTLGDVVNEARSQEVAVFSFLKKVPWVGDGKIRGEGGWTRQDQNKEEIKNRERMTGGSAIIHKPVRGQPEDGPSPGEGSKEDWRKKKGG